jgi:predicted amidohydrolase
LKIAIVQLKTEEGSQVKDQFHRAVTLLDSLEVCDLVILPELWLQGAFGKWSEQGRLSGSSTEYLEYLSDWALKRNTWICTGSFLVEGHDRKISNTCYLVDQNGNMIANYSKRHLFSYGSNEAERLRRGTTRTELKTSFGTMGFAICYDLRFPEHFRKSANIPEIFVIPSAWPESRIKQFNSLAIGRAIENQCYIIACNGVGKQGEVFLGGNSLVIDYEGVTKLQLSNEEEIGYCTLSLGALRKFRAEFGVLNDRVLD